MGRICTVLAHRLQAVVSWKDFRRRVKKIFNPSRRENLVETEPLIAEQEPREQPDQDLEQNAVVYTDRGVDVVDQDQFLEELQDEADGEHLNCVEDQQKPRNKQYLSFIPEDVEDYTGGPARFVVADDGVKQCASLLLTYDMSQKIKRLLRFHQQYCQQERYHAKKIDEVERFEREIRLEMLAHNDRLETAKEADGTEEEDTNLSSPDPSQQRIKALEARMEDMLLKRDELDSSLRYKARLLRKATAEVASYLEEAFVVGLLLNFEEAEEIPVETCHSGREDRSSASEVSTGEYIRGGYFPEPLEHFDQPPEIADETVEVDPSTLMWQAEQNFNAAQKRFNQKEIERDQNAMMARQAEMQGQDPWYVNQEHFDLRWLQEFRIITCDLIYAEEALAKSKAAAIAAGYNISSDDQSSAFGEDFDCDGYHVSQEVDLT